MKLSNLYARFFPVERDATQEQIGVLIGKKAREFADEKIIEADHRAKTYLERALLAEDSARKQIDSLQTMYIEMLTERHREIADLNRLLTMKE